MQRVTGRRQTWTVVLRNRLRAAPGSAETTHGLRSTLELALAITAPERVVTPLVPDDPADLPAGPALSRRRPLYEPADRGTTCSLLLALGQIEAADPDALVVAVPAGPFVGGTLGAHLLAALDLACRIDRVVVLGAAPTSGLAGTLGRLRASVRRSLPDLAAAFDPLVELAGTPRERPWLEELYARLPHRTIESHVLPLLGDELVVVGPEGVSRHMLEMLGGAADLPLHAGVS